MKRLAIITTHPIQYNAPFFRLLAQSGIVSLKVFYTWGQSEKGVYDPSFGHNRQWDIPLLEGYDHCFVHNTAAKPGSHHFWGIQNPDLIKKIKDWQPNIVWVYGWSFWSHWQVMRYFKGKIPVWFRGDSTLLDQQKGWKAVLKKLLLTQVYRCVDRAFYPGTNSKNYFLAYGLKPAQLQWLPHAVDNDRFAMPEPEQVALLKQQLAIPPNALVIGFAGKLQAKKNPFLLLKAFQEINHPNTYLVYCGDGPLLNDLKQAAYQNNHIRFLPFQNQSVMPAVYQMMDIFCLPSKGPGETWGLAVNEAMAAGAAVIVADKVGCSADLVREDAIFTAGSLTELKQKLISLLQNPPLLLTHKNTNKETISNWCFERGIDQLRNCC